MDEFNLTLKMALNCVQHSVRQNEWNFSTVSGPRSSPYKLIDFAFPSKMCVSLTTKDKKHKSTDALLRTWLNGPALVIVNFIYFFQIVKEQSPIQETHVIACVTRAYPTFFFGFAFYSF